MQPLPVVPLKGRKHLGGEAPQGSKLTTALIIIGVALCVGALIWLGVIAFGYIDAQNKYHGYAESSQLDTVVADEVAEDPSALSKLTVDWDALRATNPDIVAWIYVPGTVINYPVVKTTDNEFYLHHNFDGSYSSSGTVFLDTKNNASLTDQQILLYGHHMNDQSMFACLVDYHDQSFFDEHQTIILATPTMNYRLEPAYVFVCAGDAQICVYNYPSLELFRKDVRSQYDSSVASSSAFVPENTMQLVELVTCSYETNDSRTILAATIAERAVPGSGTTVSASTATTEWSLSPTETAEQAMST